MVNCIFGDSGSLVNCRGKIGIQEVLYIVTADDTEFGSDDELVLFIDQDPLLTPVEFEISGLADL